MNYAVNSNKNVMGKQAGRLVKRSMHTARESRTDATISPQRNEGTVISIELAMHIATHSNY